MLRLSLGCAAAFFALTTAACEVSDASSGDPWSAEGGESAIAELETYAAAAAEWTGRCVSPSGVAISGALDWSRKAWSGQEAAAWRGDRRALTCQISGLRARVEAAWWGGREPSDADRAEAAAAYYETAYFGALLGVRDTEFGGLCDRLPAGAAGEAEANARAKLFAGVQLELLTPTDLAGARVAAEAAPACSSPR